MFQCFYPDRLERDTYGIDYDELFQKGYRGIIFDIDNTLVPHGAPATPKAIAFFEQLRKIGFETCLLSNNQQPRVKTFAEATGSKFICNAHKPSRKGYEAAMKAMGTDLPATIFIGDQIFTDIYGARCAGMANILVQPIHPKEEIQIVLKRYLEKIVLREYKKKSKERKESVQKRSLSKEPDTVRGCKAGEITGSASDRTESDNKRSLSKEEEC